MTRSSGRRRVPEVRLVPEPSSATATIVRGGVGAIGVFAGAVAVLTPLAFAALHLVYAQFYDRFGLAPEDVGLDSSRVLATSVTAIVFSFVVWAFNWGVLLAVVYVAVAFVAGKKDPAVPSRGHDLAGAALGTVGLIAGAYVFAYPIVETHVVDGADERSTWVALAIPVLALVVRAVRHDYAAAVREWAGNGTARLILAGVAVVAGLYLAGSTLSREVSTIGRDQAAEVVAGRAVLEPTLELPGDVARLRALDITADVVAVQWLGARPPPGGAGDCLLYLGAGGGTALLWDASRDPQALLRVPATTVVLTTTGAAGCARR